MTAPQKTGKKKAKVPGADLRRRKPELKAEVEREITELRQVAGRSYELRPEWRCRVCCDYRMRGVVDRLLSVGEPYQGIVDILKPVNESRPKNKRITYNSVWHHARNHFNITDPAQRIYRRIVESRAAQNDRDFIGGVANLVDTYAYLEIMQQRGFESLVDPNNKISAESGMAASVKLHELTRPDESQQMGEVIASLNRIIAAVRDNVPKELWPVINAAIEGHEQQAIEGQVIVEEDWGPGADFEFDHDAPDEDIK